MTHSIWTLIFLSILLVYNGLVLLGSSLGVETFGLFELVVFFLNSMAIGLYAQKQFEVV